MSTKWKACFEKLIESGFYIGIGYFLCEYYLEYRSIYNLEKEAEILEKDASLVWSKERELQKSFKSKNRHEKFQEYTSFSGMPLRVMSPFQAPTGSLPIFYHGKRSVMTFIEITINLRKKNCSVDFGLTPKQCAQIAAYVHFLQETLYSAIQYVQWVDTKNYIEFSRPWCAKPISFPFNCDFSGKHDEEAEWMKDALDRSAEPGINESNLHAAAEKCLSATSARLGDTKIFFGSDPASMDTVVYAYLAPLLRVPNPSPEMKNPLKGFNNLVQFVVHISQRYFPSTRQQYESKSNPKNT